MKEKLFIDLFFYEYFTCSFWFRYCAIIINLEIFEAFSWLWYLLCHPLRNLIFVLDVLLVDYS